MKFIAYIGAFLLMITDVQAQSLENLAIPGDEELFPFRTRLREQLVSSAPLNSSQGVTTWIQDQYNGHLKAGYELRLIHQNESFSGEHFTYQAFIKGNPLWGTSIRVHLKPNGQIRWIQEQLPPLKENVSDFEAASNHNACLYIESGLISGILQYEWVRDEKRLLFFTDDKTVYDLGPAKLNWREQDTSIWARVFSPNPIVSEGAAYGGEFSDRGDRDSDSLEKALKWVQLRGERTGDTTFLRDGFLRFGQVSDPVVPEPFSLNDSFNFTRSETIFEQVNAFYHLQQMSDYLRSKGFDAMLDSIIIDAHALNGADNSTFDPSVYPYTLEFGEGGVDDAEDGQVVVHEFGHSMSVIASPNTVNGSQRRAMEEGNADYTCMSYSRGISEFAGNQVFSWDGHNEFWPGFTVNTSKQFPHDLTNRTDNDREIWSSAVMCIFDQIGKSRADSLIFEHLFYQASNSTMPDMANIILGLNEDIFNGENSWKIRNCFAKYNILSPSNAPSLSKHEFAILKGSQSFAEGFGPAVVSLPFKQQNEWQLYDLQGVLVKKGSDRSDVISISPDGLSSNMYILRVMIEGQEQHFKLMRY